VAAGHRHIVGLGTCHRFSLRGPQQSVAHEQLSADLLLLSVDAELQALPTACPFHRSARCLFFDQSCEQIVQCMHFHVVDKVYVTYIVCNNGIAQRIMRGLLALNLQFGNSMCAGRRMVLES
jgi:hypothetical protein